MSQAPMCDNYEEDGGNSVLALWPSGKVQRFPSLAKAKTMLMRQHFQYLVCTEMEAWMYREQNSADWYDKWKLTEEETFNLTPPALWDYLVDISTERDPWAKASDIPDSDRLSKRKTAAGYTVSQEACVAFANAKAPKQAKVLAGIFAEHADGPLTDEDIEHILRGAHLKGVLSTKQKPMRIFAYYRPQLLEAGVLRLRS